MSREGAQRAQAAPAGGTPIWVWVVYGLGIFGATVFVASALFVAGAYISSDEVPVTLNASLLGIVVWGGLVLVALATWIARRSGGAR